MRTARGLLFVLVPIIIIFVIFYAPAQRRRRGHRRAQAERLHEVTRRSRRRRTRAEGAGAAIDAAKTYTAAIETSCGTITVGARRRRRRRSRRTTSSSLVRSRLLRRPAAPPGREGLRDPGRRPRRATGQGGPGYTVVGEVPDRQLPGRVARRGQERAATPAGRLRLAVLHRHRRKGATLAERLRPVRYVTSGLEVAQKIESFAPAAGDGKPTQKVTIKKITDLPSRRGSRLRPVALPFAQTS